MKAMNAAMAAALLVAAAAPATAANPADAALNGLYETVAAGVAANSGEGVLAAFADDAILLDPRPGALPASGAFRAGIVRMAAQLKADGAAVRAEYRIQQRMVSGDIAVDTGYRRQTLTVSAGGAGPMPGTQYHKFLVVAQRQRDGRWKIVRDASLPSTKEAWDAAVRVDGLKFDA